MTAIVNKILPVVSKIIPIIVVVTDNNIIFIEIYLVAENNSNALWTKYPDKVNKATPGIP
jgi:hypothetical protein